MPIQPVVTRGEDGKIILQRPYPFGAFDIDFKKIDLFNGMYVDMNIIRLYIEAHLLHIERHPEDQDVIILSYSDKTVWKRYWDTVTMQCRGLIVRESTGEVLAVPFQKFFNYRGETLEIPEVNIEDLPTEDFTVTEKYDGSLVISYRLYSKDKLRWATKGSFISDHAQDAQYIWERQHADADVPYKLTLMMEFISEMVNDKNLVKYEFDDTLILLGAINEFEVDYSYTEMTEMFPSLMIAEQHQVDDLETYIQSLQDAPLTTEGVVIRFDGNTRLKVKTRTFINHVRATHQLTPVKIALYWKDERVDELLAITPEEFHKEIEQNVAKLDNLLGIQNNIVDLLYAGLFREKEILNKKEFADAIKQSTQPDTKSYAPVLFAKFDKNDQFVQQHLRRRIEADGKEIAKK